MHLQLCIVHDGLKYDNTDFRIEELIILALHNISVEFHEQKVVKRSFFSKSGINNFHRKNGRLNKNSSFLSENAYFT